MSEIKVKCLAQNLRFENMPEIFSGDVNYDTVVFDFCEKWIGFTKTAIFYRSRDEVYYQLLDENDRCIVPKEVLKDKGTIYIGAFGVQNDIVLTSEVIPYRILLGAKSDDIITPDPTPDIFEQLISDYDEIKKLMNQLLIDQDEYQRQWLETVDQSIQDARVASSNCIDAIQALEFEVRDMNGGDPATLSYENDANGGYPN